MHTLRLGVWNGCCPESPPCRHAAGLGPGKCHAGGATEHKMAASMCALRDDIDDDCAQVVAAGAGEAGASIEGRQPAGPPHPLRIGACKGQSAPSSARTTANGQASASAQMAHSEDNAGHSASAAVRWRLGLGGCATTLTGPELRAAHQSGSSMRLWWPAAPTPTPPCPATPACLQIWGQDGHVTTKPAGLNQHFGRNS
jgi:hypothetical protein